MLSRSISPLVIALAVSACGGESDEGNRASLAAKQAQVVERGHRVMPFDINRTMHHFTKTPLGGVQQVLSTDGDPQQVSLIRQHLQAEAGRFRHGDFSDPSTIHGADMPGLNALAAGAGRIDIRYTDTPAGGQIAYESSDRALVTAIHNWFDAQVREHGQHAMPM